MTTREYVETVLGIPWADWRAMTSADRVATVTGRPAPGYIAAEPGPERLAAFHEALDHLALP